MPPNCTSYIWPWHISHATKIYAYLITEILSPQFEQDALSVPILYTIEAGQFWHLTNFLLARWGWEANWMLPSGYRSIKRRLGWSIVYNWCGPQQQYPVPMTNRTVHVGLSQSRELGKCEFCSQTFHLVETLESHKKDCFLGKSMKKPLLIKPPSKSKPNRQLMITKETVRSAQNEKFRIKKLGVGNHLNNIQLQTSNGWGRAKPVDANRNTTPHSSTTAVDRTEQTSLFQGSSTQACSSLGTESDIRRCLQTYKQGCQFASQQLSDALVTCEIDWELDIQMYINQLHQIQASLSQSGDTSKLGQRYCSMRGQILSRIRQRLSEPATIIPNTSRTSATGEETQTREIQNQSLSICPECLGQLGFGQSVTEFHCGHRYHGACFKALSSIRCIGCGSP